MILLLSAGLLLLLLLLLFSVTVFPATASPLSDGPWGQAQPVADPASVVVVSDGTVRLSTMLTTCSRSIRKGKW